MCPAGSKGTISVIVPVYQQPVTLDWLLESLSRQDYDGQWEILVADDGSDPGVLSIVKDASRRKDIDVKYVWQPDNGFRLSRSRNNAIRCARGDVLVFVDADMIVHPDFVRRHKAAHTGERRLVCGTRTSASVSHTLTRQAINEILEPGMTRRTDRCGQEEWTTTSWPWMAILGCNFSVTNSPDVFFNEQFVGWGTEDREFACRLSRRHGYQIVVSHAVDGVHVSFPSQPATLNPVRKNEHAGIIRLIRNRLLFRHLHSDVDISPVLEGLLSFFLDIKTDTWYSARPKQERCLDEVIALAESWMDSHGISFRPEKGATARMMAVACTPVDGAGLPA